MLLRPFEFGSFRPESAGVLRLTQEVYADQGRSQQGQILDRCKALALIRGVFV